MIQIKDKYTENTVKIPKNTDYSGDFVFRVYSPINQTINEYNVSDEETSNNFYVFHIEELVNLADGEYNWTLIQDEDTVASGILQIGDGEETVNVIQYNVEIEYRQYYPARPVKGYITLSTEAQLPDTVDKIDYKVVSNRKWVLNFYVRHHTQSDWSLAWSENHSERGLFNGSINIGPQVTDYPRHYKIVVETDDGLGTASQEITQDAHYYFTVDVYSSSDTIPASATTLSYGIQYSEYQSVHTGKFLIYKDGELYLEQPFGWYPYGFSTYTQIPANSGETDVSWTVTGILDNGQTDSCTVVQEMDKLVIRTEAVIPASAENITYSVNVPASCWWAGIRIYENGLKIDEYRVSTGTTIHNIPISANTNDVNYMSYKIEAYTINAPVSTVSANVKQLAAGDVDYSVMPLTIEMLENGDISWVFLTSPYIDFFVNGEKIIPNRNTLSLAAGDELSIIVNIDRPYVYENRYISCTGNHNIKGNIMSLVQKGFNNVEELSLLNQFNGLFINDEKLIDASKLMLPAKTLTDGCYQYMFCGCASLINPPELPSFKMTINCYQGMFQACTSLTTAPKLPATGLDDGCYQYMFNGCYSLINAPELPAQEAKLGCYRAMFMNCTSLTTAPEIPALGGSNAMFACAEMFRDCTSLVNPPSVLHIWDHLSCEEMFRDCTSLEKAPDLIPIGTGYYSAYPLMFHGCTSLNYIKCLADATHGDDPFDFYSWVQNVLPTGTFVKKRGINWVTGESGIPDGWTVIEVDE